MRLTNNCSVVKFFKFYNNCIDSKKIFLYPGRSVLKKEVFMMSASEYNFFLKSAVNDNYGTLGACIISRIILISLIIISL